MTLPPVAVTASPVPDVRIPWTDNPLLSIIIVTYGTGSVLERCLGHLSSALRDDGLAAEVIVVDNPHPGRGTWAGDRVRITTEGIRIVRPDVNLGFAGGNNIGAALARAERLCLLNPDVFLESGQLARLLEISQAADHVIVSPALSWPDGSPQEFGFRVLANGETRAILEPGQVEADYGSAACWVLPASLFSALGGFDERYFPAYYEDVDFVFRARELGYETLLLDDVRVVHAARSNFAEGWDGAAPDVSRQRELFVDRWGHLLAARPTA